MRIVAFAGLARAGKTTAAEMFADWCTRHGLNPVRMSFAEDLKKAAAYLRISKEKPLQGTRGVDGRIIVRSARKPACDIGSVPSLQIGGAREIESNAFVHAKWIGVPEPAHTSHLRHGSPKLANLIWYGSLSPLRCLIKRRSR